MLPVGHAHGGSYFQLNNTSDQGQIGDRGGELGGGGWGGHCQAETWIENTDRGRLEGAAHGEYRQDNREHKEKGTIYALLFIPAITW